MTGQQIIDKAFLHLGVIAAGETASSEEYDDALETLNHMIEAWNAQTLPIPELTNVQQALSGASPYTLSIRPMNIKSASISVGGIIIPIDIVDSDGWTDGKRNHVLFYDGGTTTPKVYLRPDASSGTLDMWSLHPLSQVGSLGADVSVQDEYLLALHTNLAVLLAASYPCAPEVYQRIVNMANDAKMSIQGQDQSNLGQVSPVPGKAPVAVQ